MAVELTLPKSGPEVEYAGILEWTVADGAAVVAGDVVVIVETDKAALELEAPSSGVLRRIGIEGETYAVGEVLALIVDDVDSETAQDIPALSGQQSGSARAPATDAKGEPVVAPARPVSASATVDAGAATTLASPAARFAARRLGVSIQTIAAATGRTPVTSRDVRAVAVSTSGGVGDATQSYEVRTLSPMRRSIARRMLDSVTGSAQVTDFRRHDVTDLIDLRSTLVEIGSALPARISVTDLVATAVVRALSDVRELNSTWDGQEWRWHHSVNLGLAVSLPDGLVVPVVPDADKLSIWELHDALARAAGDARARRLPANAYEGGTFTLTNISSYGSEAATPILIPGQVAILAIGRVTEQPVVRKGSVQVGHTMITSLTFDHQLIDGETAGRFQNALGCRLAEPLGLVAG